MFAFHVHCIISSCHPQIHTAHLPFSLPDYHLTLDQTWSSIKSRRNQITSFASFPFPCLHSWLIFFSLFSGSLVCLSCLFHTVVTHLSVFFLSLHALRRRRRRRFDLRLFTLDLSSNYRSLLLPPVPLTNWVRRCMFAISLSVCSPCSDEIWLCFACVGVCACV